jgi:hypothetical protein
MLHNLPLVYLAFGHALEGGSGGQCISLAAAADSIVVELCSHKSCAVTVDYICGVACAFHRVVSRASFIACWVDYAVLQCSTCVRH